MESVKKEPIVEEKKEESAEEANKKLAEKLK